MLVGVAPGATASPPVPGSLQWCELGVGEALARARRAPWARRAPFRAAVAAARRRQWKRADRAFDRALDLLAHRVNDLFQRPQRRALRGRRLREVERFLRQMVYGPSPVLVVGDDDFLLRPELGALAVGAACLAGHLDRARRVRALTADADASALRLLDATLALASGHPQEALAALGEAPGGWRAAIVRAAARVALGDAPGARSALEAARRQCVGPTACGAARKWARRVERLLEPASSGATPARH